MLRLARSVLAVLTVNAPLPLLLAGGVLLGQPAEVRADDSTHGRNGFAYRILGAVAIDFPQGLITLGLSSTKKAGRTEGHMVWSDVILEDKDAPRLRFTESFRFTLFTNQGIVQGTGILWVNSTQKEAEVVDEFFPGSGTSVLAVHARLEGIDQKGRAVEAQLDGLFEFRFGEAFIESQIGGATVGARFLPPPGSQAEATLTVQHSHK